MPARVWRNRQTIKGPSGATYAWHESTDSVSPGDLSLSRLTNSQAVLKYHTDAENIYALAKSEDLLTAILGGYYQGAMNKHYTPLQHPYLKGLFATEITSIKGIGQPSINAGTTTAASLPRPFASYDEIELTILFQTLPFFVDKGNLLSSSSNVDVNGQPWNPNWFSLESHVEARYTNASFGFYVFTGLDTANNGIYSNFPHTAASGVYVRRQIERIHITFHQVPGELAFDGGSDTNTANIFGSQYVGFVNSNDMLGYKAEELLLDSMDVIPRGDCLGNRRYYDFRAELIFDSIGWNNVLNPSNRPQRVVATLGGTGPIYQSYNFAVLFSHINP